MSVNQGTAFHHRWHYRRLKWEAMFWLALGRNARAQAVFDRMLDEFPGDPYALTSRAHLLATAGRREEAIADYRELTDRHPDYGAAAWFNYAFLLEEAGRYGEAEAAFRRALELDPKLDRAWYGLGLVLIRAHRFDEAIEALKRNTELQPMSPYAWYQLARVHVDRHEPEEAAKIIRHLKGFEPKVAAQLERETGLAV
ncbi:tetratricopeptide repeat protein [Caldimonas thermodepolymerans]|jgi:tetratricopeptide (TPR) repeat protein|uniref:Tetratricopeptide repeat protein n=2 Tax=Caldimonas thermodepolymerans TaxID=215580 RepID=A0AA46DDL3_9BURK|nr:tetratricopeptide repeat protein [Caldimonas thermodepolymerans]QPC30099.1 tetratricopeptide repeat protein [Caldimonas thermodepolymerans]RDI00475.1 tetratricopeptide repeat protein [Caldimonas thermodepolymerans]TCP07246.1 tetratricopeptide repeat protein [Caldimonas thermodepolymerans]UZG42852.1 tetratricopeptide repeat protein [Caldimonas thermodepolymerans]UZG46517.1 tetratricopeptide repeat protein [Caldimonas thermodepolymerans]